MNNPPTTDDGLLSARNQTWTSSYRQRDRSKLPTNFRREENSIGTTIRGTASPRESADGFDVSELRQVLQFCKGIQSLDLSRANELYRGLMKKTNNNDQLQREDTILSERDQLSDAEITRNKHDEEARLHKLVEDCRKKIEQQKCVIRDLEEKVNRVKEENKEKDDQIARLNRDMKNLHMHPTFETNKDEIKDLERDLQTVKDNLKQKEVLLQNSEKENKNKDDQIARLHGERTMLSERSSVETKDMEIRELQNELLLTRENSNVTEVLLKKTEREKQDILTRLSREMGSKLTDNNPAIADLSDPNRATKLAEKYNELYDNEWTDALENLIIDMEEERAIRLLLDILKNCCNWCSRIADDQLNKLQSSLVNPASVYGSGTKEQKEPKQILKLLKDARKLSAMDTVSNLYKDYTKTSSLSEQSSRVSNYVKKCLEIGWLMTLQDPPVVLGKEALLNEKFDANMYKEYTDRGATVLYTVWLPLLLHTDGPLLCKGVAQPLKIKKKADLMASTLDSTKKHDVKNLRDRYDENRLKENYEMKLVGTGAVNNTLWDKQVPDTQNYKISPKYGYRTNNMQEKQYGQAYHHTSSPVTTNSYEQKVYQFNRHSNYMQYILHIGNDNQHYAKLYNDDTLYPLKMFQDVYQLTGRIYRE